MRKLLLFCYVFFFAISLYGKFSDSKVYAYTYIDEPEDEFIVDNSGLIEFFIDSATVPSDFTLSSSSIFHSDFQSDGRKQYAFYSREYFGTVNYSNYFYDISNVNIYRGFYNQSTSSDMYWFEMAERFEFSQNNDCMFFKDNSYTVTITNLNNCFYIYDNEDYSNPVNYAYFETVDWTSVRGYGYDEKWVLFDEDEIKLEYIFNEDNSYDLRMHINAPFDIYYIRFELGFKDTDMTGFRQDYFDTSKYSIYQSKGSTSNSTFICHENTSDKGLLKNIIQWLKDIKDSIVNVKDTIINLPSKIATAIKGFFDNIIDALSDLGSFIIDSIKGIFIPSSEELDNLIDDFITFFEEEFGFIFQIEVIIRNFYSNINENAKKEYIEFPRIELELVDSVFTFGGQQVKVVPNGFESIIFYLKKILNFVLTIGFINSLKYKFEKFFGGV